MGRRTLSRMSYALTLILTLALVPHPEPTNAVTNMAPAKVSITNLLRSKEKLVVHCRDQKRDLRAQVLATNKTFRFQVEAEIIGEPHYGCSFKWPTAFQRFDIYDEERDKDQCGEICDWQIKETGPCLVMDRDQSWVRCFIWPGATL